MARLLFAILISIVATAASAEKCELCDFKVDAAGNVVFTSLIENLPLSQDDIYIASRNYIENAYKETRYKLLPESNHNGQVGGEGVFSSFFESNSLSKGTIFNAVIHLKIDAKDGRARVQVIVRNYQQVILSDFGNKERMDVLISSTAPLTENKEKQKMYKKAFSALHELVHKTMFSVRETLNATQPSASAESDAW